MVVPKLLLFLWLAALAASQNCPSGWLEYSGQCYLLTDVDTQELTWHDAYAACLAEGADLASINSQEEQDFITETAEAEGFTDAFWIGLNKFGDYNGELGWTDGSGTDGYDNWAPDQPNNDQLELCTYSLAVPNDNCFDTTENVNVVKGLMYYPWDEDRPNTFSFGYYWTYDFPQWCEDQCAMEKDCHAWTYFTPYYYQDYQWQSYCVGRSDFSEVQVPEYDTWSGFKQPCGEVGLWSTANCGLSKGYMCKKAVGSSDGPNTPPPTEPITGFCPQGWHDAGNKCFLIEVEDNQYGKSWEDALTYCRGMTVAGLRDIDLATISTAAENNLLTYNIQKRSYGFWLGFHQFDTWAWTENTVVDFTNWGPGQPDGGRVDNCAEMWVVPGPTGTWNDLRCEDLRGVVCQGYKDGSLSNPPATTPSSCPEGYTPYWYSCYKLVTGGGSWTSGEQACSGEQAHLVSIHSEPENAFVRSLAWDKNALPVWIGWREGGGGEFRWTDGWPNAVYSRWASDEPSEDGEGCVAMNAEGEWFNGLCSAQYSYMCKTTDEPRPVTPPVGDGSCPRDWELFGDNCYHYGTAYDYPDYDKFDWATAIQKCKERAGAEFASSATLASIHSYIENEYIKSTLIRIRDEDYVYDLNSAWIGLSKKELGADYMWTDGSSTDLMHWAPGEPNDKDGTENCAEIILRDFEGMWNDHSCEEARYFVCKAPTGAPATTPTMPPVLPGDCPSDEWEEYGADCYLIRPDDYESWDTAHGVCVTETRDFAYRGNIASVANSAENYWLHNRLVDKSQMPIRRSAWIGLYRFDPDSEWRWFDGSDVGYVNWNVGQPNDDLCVEVLTESANQGYWADNDCSELRGFVCKVQKDTGKAEKKVSSAAPLSAQDADEGIDPRKILAKKASESKSEENRPVREGDDTRYRSRFQQHGTSPLRGRQAPEDVKLEAPPQQDGQKKQAESVVFGIIVGVGAVGTLALSVYLAVQKRKGRAKTSPTPPAPEEGDVVAMS